MPASSPGQSMNVTAPAGRSPHPTSQVTSTDAQRDLLLKIHEFGLELASLSASADLHEHIARMLTTLTGAGLVTMGEYDPVRRGIVLRRVDTDSTVLALAKQALGFEARELVSPLSDDDYARIVGERVAVHHSLADVSFGAFPRAASAILQAVTGFDTFIGMVFVNEGTLAGTAVLGFRKHVAHPPLLLLDAFASIAAISLKRRAVEGDLRRTTEQLRAVGTHLPGVIYEFVAGPAGWGLNYMSDSVERIVGEPVEPLQSLFGRLAARVVAEDQGRFLSSIEHAVTHQAQWDCDARITTDDGRLIHFRGSSHPRVVGDTIIYDGFLLDVTEQKRAEASAREHRAMVDAIVESSQDWIWAMEPDGRHTYSNPAVERILGHTPADVLAAGLELLHPGDVALFERTLAEACATRRGWTGVLGRWRCRDGSYRHLESNAVPLLSPTGDLMGFRGVDRDVTDRVRAAEERERLTGQLQQAQKMESVGRLAGGVAHDFNNLLTVINGYSDLLLADVNPADPAHESLEQIRRAGERAASLTQRLLAFSRKQVLQPRVLNIDRVLGDLQPMLARLVGEDVDVRLDLGAPHATVHADPHQLEQVVLNLVVNARDAMPRGGRLVIATADMTASALPPTMHGYVSLTVSDSGVGMDEPTRQQMFEPFFTTKGAGKGTGLGLSMVHGIVAQSGGRIDVETTPDVGTAIHIYLPKITQAEPPDASPSLDRDALGGHETILVVEDQAEVRNYAATALRAYGYSVVAAENAGQALLIDEREHVTFDLVLTDVVMPHMSGRELAERLESRSPGLRVLFMSGYTDDVVVHHGVQEARVGFIQKPFSPQQLALAVRGALRRPPRGGAPA